MLLELEMQLGPQHGHSNCQKQCLWCFSLLPVLGFLPIGKPMSGHLLVIVRFVAGLLANMLYNLVALVVPLKCARARALLCGQCFWVDAT